MLASKLRTVSQSRSGEIVATVIANEQFATAIMDAVVNADDFTELAETVRSLEASIGQIQESVSRYADVNNRLGALERDEVERRQDYISNLPRGTRRVHLSKQQRFQPNNVARGGNNGQSGSAQEQAEATLAKFENMN